MQNICCIIDHMFYYAKVMLANNRRSTKFTCEYSIELSQVIFQYMTEQIPIGRANLLYISNGEARDSL